MTAYDDGDRSRDDARPAELFQFSGGVIAHYTTAQESVVFGGVEYLPDFITHGELEQSDELNKQSLEITVKGSSDVARLYIAEIPARSVNVRVYRFLVGLAEYRLVWAGRVVKPSFTSDNDECRLSCEPIFTLLRRPGLRRNYQILCPYALYDSRCGLQSVPYMVYDAVTSLGPGWVSGPAVAAKPAGYFLGGALRFGDVFRLIVDHEGGRIHVGGACRG